MRRRDERGAAAAELAIVLPIFLILVMGIVEFGLAFNRLQGVHAAAREAARVGAVTPGFECARALDAVSGLGVEGFVCTVVQSCPGDRVIVEVTATEEIDIPLVGTRSVSLDGHGEFKCEG